MKSKQYLQIVGHKFKTLALHKSPVVVFGIMLSCTVLMLSGCLKSYVKVKLTGDNSKLGSSSLTLKAEDVIKEISYQGQNPSYKIEVNLSGEGAALIKEITGLDEKLNYLGGSFPGTGGTCDKLVIASCTLVVEAKNRLFPKEYTHSLSINYKNKEGLKSAVLELKTKSHFLAGYLSFTDTSQLLSGLGGALGIWSDGTRLIVTNTNANNIYIWNNYPKSDATPPDLVLGSDYGLVGPDYSSLSTCRWPDGVTSDGSKIAVTCRRHHKVLIWNSWPSQNFQPADLTLGQPDQSLGTANYGGVTASSLNNPHDVLIANSRLYIADTDNNRVLIYNQIPTASMTSADVVLGQGAFTTNSAATTATGLRLPRGLAVGQGRLYVSDGTNNRIVSYPSELPATGAAADVVIGQTLMTTSSTNAVLAATASTLWSPHKISISGDGLYVADLSNYRILKYSPLPTSSTPAAVRVWGQNSFSGGNVDDSFISDRTLDQPRHAFAVGSKMFITDHSNNRLKIFETHSQEDNESPTLIWGQRSAVGQASYGAIESETFCEHPFLEVTSRAFIRSCFRGNRVLIWNDLPSSPLSPPDAVIGQDNFTDSLRNKGGTVSKSSLNASGQVSLETDGLWIADSGNHRVLKFDTIPSSGGGHSADLVIGQADFTSGSANRGGAIDGNTLSSPGHALSANGRLYIADSGNNRVLIYGTVPTDSSTAANLVLGQATFTTGSANRGGAVASNTLSGAGSIAINGESVAVSDTNNNRILFWNTPITTPGQPADVVLGQLDMTSNGANLGQYTPSSNSLSNPQNIKFVGGKFFVADRNNKRVLVWNSWPSVSGQPADQVYFQKDFTSAEVANGPNGISDALSIGVLDNALFVSDRFNFRILGVPLNP